MIPNGSNFLNSFPIFWSLEKKLSPTYVSLAQPFKATSHSLFVWYTAHVFDSISVGCYARYRMSPVSGLLDVLLSSNRLATPNEFPHRVSSGILHVLHQMPVNIQRCRDALMSEPFLNDLRILSGGDQK